jgi:hypothetical protein
VLGGMSGSIVWGLGRFFFAVFKSEESKHGNSLALVLILTGVPTSMSAVPLTTVTR